MATAGKVSLVAVGHRGASLNVARLKRFTSYSIARVAFSKSVNKLLTAGWGAVRVEARVEIPPYKYLFETLSRSICLKIQS